MEFWDPTTSSSEKQINMKLYMSESKSIVEAEITKVEPLYTREAIHPRKEDPGIRWRHALRRNVEEEEQSGALKEEEHPFL